MGQRFVYITAFSIYLSCILKWMRETTYQILPTLFRTAEWRYLSTNYWQAYTVHSKAWKIGKKFNLLLITITLSLENKILFYKTIIKPIWTYGAEIWGCASKSNISIIQRGQSKILCMIANAPWYVPSIILNEDLNVLLVKEVIKQRSRRYHNKMEAHVNVLIQPLLEPHNERRLKRNWPADLREG
jgi:hypothetical protein